MSKILKYYLNINSNLLWYNIFILYLVIIFFLYNFFINEYCLNFYTTNYAISDLLIHYNGEFVRRGLVGSILLFLSDILSIDLKIIIKYFFNTVYFFYFIIYFYFLKNLFLKNKLLIIFI